MKTVLLRASAITMSGYGVHARQIARWLLDKEKAGTCKLFIQLLNWGDTPWILDKTRSNGLIGEIMGHAGDPGQQCDVSIQLQLPNEWDAKLARFNVGVTAAVETDKCNPEWIACCNAMNLIIVPSEHTKLTLKNTGVITTPIIVIPESFPDCFTSEIVEPFEAKFETPFNFLVFGQITGNNPENDRKNIFYTIKWLCETFKDSKDVGIIIKTNHGRNTRVDRNVVANMIGQLLGEVRRGSKSPPVYLVHGDLKDEEVLSLLKDPTVKAMVNLTRGEGFGLPLLEAAVAGLPVIATNWSAHTEFLNQGKWVQIDYSMAPIHDTRVDEKIFMKGSRWAQPSEDNFKRRVKKFYESPSTPLQWARDLSASLTKTHSHDAISAKYDEALREIF